jgi:hypothetical protein
MLKVHVPELDMAIFGCVPDIIEIYVVFTSMVLFKPATLTLPISYPEPAVKYTLEPVMMEELSP